MRLNSLACYKSLENYQTFKKWRQEVRQSYWNCLPAVLSFKNSLRKSWHKTYWGDSRMDNL